MKYKRMVNETDSHEEYEIKFEDGLLFFMSIVLAVTVVTQLVQAHRVDKVERTLKCIESSAIEHCMF